MLAFIVGIVVGVITVLEILDGVNGMADVAVGIRDGWRKVVERMG